MKRVAFLVFWLLGACGNPLGNFTPEFDFKVDVFANGPAFFTRIDASNDWVGANDYCGLRTDGSLHCWEIIDGKATVSEVDAGGPYSGLSSEEAIGDAYKPVSPASTRRWCALDNDGSIHCWSRPHDSSKVTDLKKSKFAGTWLALSTSEGRTCAIRPDKSLWCWGMLFYSTGETVPETGEPEVIVRSDTPYPVTDGSWKAIASSANSGGLNIHFGGPFCGLRIDGSLWCIDAFKNDFEPSKPSLQRVGEFPEWESVHVGIGRVCGLDRKRALTCIEDGLRKAFQGEWVSFSMQGETLCGVQADNSLWCWGDLPGDGELYSSHFIKERQKDWQSVTVGSDFICAIKRNQSLHCLGLPGWFNLGGDTVKENPVMVDGKTLGID